MKPSKDPNSAKSYLEKGQTLVKKFFSKIQKSQTCLESPNSARNLRIFFSSPWVGQHLEYFRRFSYLEKGRSRVQQADSNFRHTTSRKGRHLGGEPGRAGRSQLLKFQIFVPRVRVDTWKNFAISYLEKGTRFSYLEKGTRFSYLEKGRRLGFEKLA